MKEIWKDVKGYEGLYQASNFGNIKSLYKNNYTQINHLDGNKLNNHVNNLEWCNSKINNLHRVYKLKRNGGIPKPKPVKCTETNTIYRSIREAEYSNNVSAIYRVLDNPNRTSGGFHWVSV